jgi:hypothetical protein
MALPINRGRRERRVTDEQHDRFGEKRQHRENFPDRSGAFPDRPRGRARAAADRMDLAAGMSDAS